MKKKMMMRKILSMLLAAGMTAMILAGCGKGENDTNVTTEERLFEDANGWTVRYDPELFEVTPGGPVTTFVYTGESAGTNMITVTYTVDGDAKTVIDSLAKSWGDKATTGECTIPGADDVQGYRASLPTGNEGSGLYMEAIARDYMDGALIFEVTGHLSGDEEMDMAVSDALASVIDSLQFVTY